MFLNPLLLIGLSAVSVPIIIHLLNRRKHQRVVWAAMRFVMLAVQKNQRRMDLEDLILLALRCLLLALLALALARPALQGASGWFGKSRVTAVIVLDNSYSMAQTDGVQSRFDQAKKKVADQILNTLTSGSSVSLLLASDVVNETIPEPTYDLNFAREKVYQAQLCDRGTNLFPAIQKALSILEGRPSIRKEIYVITDGQAAGWRQTGDIRQILEENKKDVVTHLIFVGESEPRNVGVSSLTLTNPLASINQSLRFVVQVTNYGRNEVRDIPVRLALDNDPPSEETTIDVLGPTGSPSATKSVSLFLKIRKEGFHTMTARIPHDQLPRDDQRTLVVQTLKQVQILLIDGKPGREPTEAETFFLKEALQPVDPMTRSKYFIQPRVVSVGELDSVRLDEYDAIVLANVGDLSTGALNSLERAVRDGRGLMIFPGDMANLNFYNEQLFKQRGLLPAMLNEARGDANQAEKFLTFQTKGFTHKIAQLWNDPAAGNIAGARFYRSYELVPEGQGKAKRGDNRKATDIGPPNVVLNFNDNTPAIIERTFGVGRVVLFAGPCSINAGWNNLPVRPKIFLPLLDRVVGSLLSRQGEILNVRVGQKFAYRVPSDLLGKDAMIARPEENQKVQDSRKVEMAGGYPMVQYDRTDVAGVYSVAIAGDVANSFKFAVEGDAAESNLEPIAKEQLDTLAGVASITSWKPGISLEDTIARQRVGTELWLYFAIAAVVLAFMETGLAHYFSRVK